MISDQNTAAFVEHAVKLTARPRNRARRCFFIGLFGLVVLLPGALVDHAAKRPALQDSGTKFDLMNFETERSKKQEFS